VRAQSLGVLDKHARSFRIATWFLPAHVRDDAAVAYAFCRWVDDTADESSSRSTARVALSELASRLGSGRGGTPLLEAYEELAGRCGFGLSPAKHLLLGAQSDLGAVRVAGDDELALYCYRVAGTVGLMMCGILGIADPEARRNGVALGMAMQLTNICRDVLEDARLDRVYLPRARLHASGVDADELARVRPGVPVSPALRRAVREVVVALVARSEELYEQAAAGFRAIPARSRLAIIVAAHLYRAIGRRLISQGADPLRGRTFVPPFAKLGVVLGATLTWLKTLLP
jgi:phytoene synthase